MSQDLIYHFGFPYKINNEKIFLNQARGHSQPKAGCGRMPGLLKLFS